MRLLPVNSDNKFSLTDPLDEHELPQFAILSHTWGADKEEVTFADLENQSCCVAKPGFKKLEICNELARRDNIEYFWVDTCCIKKTDSAELSEAIRSMFNWYSMAKVCYVYLSDVSTRENNSRAKLITVKQRFRKSRWFTRGWTLQELLAPRIVQFYSLEGDFICTKKDWAELIEEITGIPISALWGAPVEGYRIADCWLWAKDRQTRRPEDRAYCLLGIFRIHMPLLYGEGLNAFRRLEEEIQRRQQGSSGNDYGGIQPSSSYIPGLNCRLCDVGIERTSVLHWCFTHNDFIHKACSSKTALWSHESCRIVEVELCPQIINTGKVCAGRRDSTGQNFHGLVCEDCGKAVCRSCSTSKVGLAVIKKHFCRSQGYSRWKLRGNEITIREILKSPRLEY